MSGHHRSSSPTISHTGSHPPDTIASSRIPQQIYLIRINSHLNNGSLNQSFKKLVQSRFKPHIPIIPRSPWSHVNSLPRFIQTNLIPPLLRVQCIRCIPPSMHRNKQTPSIFRTFAEHPIIELHLQPLPGKIFQHPKTMIFFLHLLLPRFKQNLFRLNRTLRCQFFVGKPLICHISQCILLQVFFQLSRILCKYPRTYKYIKY